MLTRHTNANKMDVKVNWRNVKLPRISASTLLRSATSVIMVHFAFIVSQWLLTN